MATSGLSLGLNSYRNIYAMSQENNQDETAGFVTTSSDMPEVQTEPQEEQQQEPTPEQQIQMKELEVRSQEAEAKSVTAQANNEKSAATIAKAQADLVQAQLETAEAQAQLQAIQSGQGEAYQQVRELVAEALAELMANNQNVKAWRVTFY